MLALLATQMPDPAVEAVDRDPGLITLAFAVVRRLRRRAGHGAPARTVADPRAA